MKLHKNYYVAIKHAEFIFVMENKQIVEEHFPI